MKKIDTVRDLILMEENGTVFATAVDSCGAIGALPGDALKIPPEIAGRFTARVALLEVLAAGAAPVWASVSVSDGPETAGRLLAGVRQALGAALPLVVSTEKNMPAAMTALGVTVTGACGAGRLRTGGAGRGDALYCAGLPLVGAETLAPGAKLPEPADLRALLTDPRVRAAVPVGSQGAAKEARVLAAESGLTARLCRPGLDLRKSAGPSSCVVFAAAPGPEPFPIPLPVTRIGELL